MDRGELRTTLIASLDPLGHKATVNFADSSSTTADLAAGADSAWSRVRRSVSGVEPIYTGTCFVEIGSARGQLLSREGAAIIGRGTLMAVGPGRLRYMTIHLQPDLAPRRDRTSISITGRLSCRR